MLFKGSENVCKSLKWEADFCPECGEAIKVVVAQNSTSTNTAMFQLLTELKHILDTTSGYLIEPNSYMHKKVNAVLAQQQHS